MIFYQFSALSHFQRFEQLSYPFYPQILESDHTLLWKTVALDAVSQWAPFLTP